MGWDCVVQLGCQGGKGGKVDGQRCFLDLVRSGGSGVGFCHLGGYPRGIGVGGLCLGDKGMSMGG